jgi:hypothetical protein
MVDEVGDMTSDATGLVPIGGGVLRTVTKDYVGAGVDWFIDQIDDVPWGWW